MTLKDTTSLTHQTLATDNDWRDRIIARKEKLAATIVRANTEIIKDTCAVGEILKQRRDAYPETRGGNQTDKARSRNLPFADFCREYLKMTEESARMFIKIYERFGQNPNTVWVLLPSSWGTLYVLSRLPTDVFDAALADGRINPDMTRAEAEALRPVKEQPEPLEQPEPNTKQTQSAPTAKPATQSTATNEDDDELVFGRKIKGMSNEVLAKHIIKHMPSPKWDTDSVISEEQKARDTLIGMQFKILGGMEVNSTTLDYEITKANKGINAALLSESIKSKIVDELNNGHTKEEAFQKAKLAIEKQLNEMIQTISQEFNNSLKQLEQIKHNLDKVDDNMLSIVFRPTSNVNEALNAANFVMKKIA